MADAKKIKVNKNTTVSMKDEQARKGLEQINTSLSDQIDKGYLYRNLIKPEYLSNLEGKTMLGVTFSLSGNIVTYNGTTTSTSSTYSNPFKLQVGTYTFSASTSDGKPFNAYVRTFDANGGTIKRFTINKSGDSITVEVTSNVSYCVLSIGGYENTTYNNTKVYFQIEEGTVAHAFTPYAPSNIELAEETADINSNLVDLKMLGWSVPSECPIQNSVSGNVFTQKVGRVDLGSLDYVLDNGTFRANMSGYKASSVNGYAIDYVFVPTWGELSNHNKAINLNSNGNTVFIRNTSYTDTSAFKYAMSGKYLYYELETPITKTIDGNEAISKINDSLDDMINSLQANIVSGSVNASGMQYSNGTATSNSTDTRFFCLQLFCGTSSNSQATEIYTKYDFTKGKFKYKFKPLSNYTILRIKHNGATKDLYVNLNVNLVANKEYIITFNCVNNDTSTSGGIVISDIVVCCTDFGEMMPKYVPCTGTRGRLNEDVAELKADLAVVSQEKGYNGDTYTFDIPDRSQFNHALLIGGEISSVHFVKILWINTKDEVREIDIINNKSRSLTYSISGNKLTVTSNASVYGGMKLII